MDTTVTGRPAAHASDLARHAAKDLTIGWIGCVAGSVAALILFRTSPAVAAFCAFGAVASAWWANTRTVDYTKASVGARSERRVAHVLDRCGAAQVAHGLLLGAGGDADHIVAGPCLAVIETKTGAGKVSIVDHGLRCGPKLLRGDPPAQARRQAEKVARMTGLRCQAVVCIPDATGTPVSANGVVVCNLAQVADVLAGLPNVCDDTLAAQVVARLAATGT